MRPFRILLSLLSTTLLLFFLFYTGLSFEAPDQVADKGHVKRSANPIRALFSLPSPSSLFAPGATISLTEDNSTFFAARPAAFGPLLPAKGLSGQVWIGTGFKDENFRRGGPQVASEGELGCSDIPGWDDQEQASSSTIRRTEISMSFTGSKSRILARQPTAVARSERSDEEEEDLSGDTNKPSEASEISGKIALLSRGGCSFLEKVNWAQRRGATAVIVGDNVRGGPLIRMYGRGETKHITIPAIFTSHTTAHLLSTLITPFFDARDPRLTKSAFKLGPRRGSKDKASKARVTGGIFDGIKDRGHPWYESEAAQSDSDGALEHTSLAKTSYRGHEQDGLWVTLTLTSMNNSPFFNTLFVLVVSPLVTLAVVYTMLLIRSRIRRRRWRAPKSVVEQLPVRIYHALSSRTSPSSTTNASPEQSTQTTPLLEASRRSSSPISRPRSRTTGGATHEEPPSSSYGSVGSSVNEREKTKPGLAAWRQSSSRKPVECAVCLEEYVDGVSKVMSLPCGHEFHADCV